MIPQIDNLKTPEEPRTCATECFRARQTPRFGNLNRAEMGIDYPR